MKVLIASDINEYHICGVLHSIMALKEELIKRGHDVRLLVPSQNNKSYIKNNDYHIASIPIPVYPNARYILKTNDKLISKIIDWKPDIIHIQTDFSCRRVATKIAKTLNIPYIFTCHGLYEDYIKYFCPSKKLGKFIIKRLSNKYYNASSALVVPSNKLKSKELEYGIKCPIKVIPSGLELSKYQKKMTYEEKLVILSKLNLKDTNKYIVSVGRVALEKNIDELINYMPDLLEKDKDIKLIIVGDGPYKKKLENKVRKMNLQDNIIFTGMIDSKIIYKYYQLGNIFVCASTSETQGFTYIEALANRLPLVCKKDECLKGIIENGINGYIYETKEDYIESIFKIIYNNSLAKRMGEKSFKKSNNYGKEEFGIKIEELYKSIIEM